MKSTVEACEQRDDKGHYAKARAGEYQNFPGVDATYDVPKNSEITIEIDHKSVDEAALQITSYLKKKFLNSSL